MHNKHMNMNIYMKHAYTNANHQRKKQVRGLEEDNSLLRQRLVNALYRIDALALPAGAFVLTCISINLCVIHKHTLTQTRTYRTPTHAHTRSNTHM